MFLVYSFKLYLTNCIPRIYEMYLNDTTDFFFPAMRQILTRFFIAWAISLFLLF